MRDIQLDKLRKVEFTMRAFRWFQNKTGISILGNELGSDGLMNENLMIHLIHAALVGGKSIEKDENIEEIIEDHFNLEIFNQVVEEITEGVNKLTGEKK